MKTKTNELMIKTMVGWKTSKRSILFTQIRL